MNKFKDMQNELNKRNKTIERLRAKDNVKYSNHLEKKIKELEIEKDTMEMGKFALRKQLAKCLKEKEKLRDAKKEKIE